MRLKKIPIIIFSFLFLLSCAPLTHKNNKGGTLYLNNISTAPLRVSASAKVFISQEQAFKLVAIDLHEWFPGLEKFTYDHSATVEKTFADGSVRRGRYKNKKMVEVVRAWEAPYFYVYQIDLGNSEAFIPIKNHMGVFTVEKEDNGAVCVTWTQYFDPKIPFTGGVIAWIMGNIAHNAFANLSQKFAHAKN